MINVCVNFSRIARATATPNLGHEIFMFQKFGVANKQSIWEKLTPYQRSWMELEFKMETSKTRERYHGSLLFEFSSLSWFGRYAFIQLVSCHILGAVPSHVISFPNSLFK